MTEEDHVRILQQGVHVWNRWREEHPTVIPSLFAADLTGVDLYAADLRKADLGDANMVRVDLGRANLREADLSGARLSKASLVGAYLQRANLQHADLREAHIARADLRRAILVRANLSGAYLTRANLSEANLTEAVLSGAKLTGANLEGALLLAAVLKRADLTDCLVYGVSAWRIDLDGAIQTNLVITRSEEPTITVDNLEVAQFIYLLLNNEKIRDVIDTITSKVVLILGRFTPKRKAILDTLREALRGCNYTPVVFDFDRPSSRDLTETVSTLAHLARFVVADITDPRSIPQELQAIVPGLAVPVQPIIARPQQPWGMFVDFPKKYHWVLAPHEYSDLDDLLPDLQAKVIAPAEAKAKQLAER